VPEVHLSEGWVGITPPPGLLELAMAQDKGRAATA
jgi:hypothetical protein